MSSVIVSPEGESGGHFGSLFVHPPPSHTHIHTRSSDLYVYAMFLSKGKLDEYEIHEKRQRGSLIFVM